MIRNNRAIISSLPMVLFYVKICVQISLNHCVKRMESIEQIGYTRNRTKFAVMSSAMVGCDALVLCGDDASQSGCRRTADGVPLAEVGRTSNLVVSRRQLH